jgi:hypothetical protein
VLDKSALYSPPAFMKFETFTRIVDQFVGLRELQLQGLGEPMMPPRFFDMVTYAAEQGVEATWNGKDYQAFRDQLASDEPPEICRSCSVYSGTF